MEYVLLLLGFISGMLVKFVDLLEDDIKDSPKSLCIIFGLFYGILLAYMISSFADIAPLFLGTVIGVALTGKIDALGHYVGIGAMLAYLIYQGIPAISVPLLAIFSLGSLGDEIIQEYVVKRKIIRSKLINTLLGFRPLLELSAILISLFTGLWVIWLTLICFDSGYILISSIGNIYIMRCHKSMHGKR